jgi:ATP-dependent DNA helicase RecG
MRATFFNQPWLTTRYRPGTRLLLHGKFDGRRGFRVTHHAVDPDAGAGWIAAADGEGAVGHYPAAEGVTSTQILTLVQRERDALRDVPEALPAAIRVREGLPGRAGALAAMHFPRDRDEAEAARAALAFEELLLSQLLFLRRRARRREQSDAHALSAPPSLSERWLERELPFVLTGGQRRAIAEVGDDLAQRQAMQRLLMGEVGSGKTVVALYAMLRAVEHGHQAALMAPTETLAEQHFATLQRLLGAEPVALALLTGSTPARRRKDILAKLGSGELPLVVGTHALIEPDVRFRSLAVAVVDEQHRFGVRQRAALEAKGTAHTLHMTATPIPRTLALAGYGDLDTSTLRELPAGRQPVETHVVDGERARHRAYERIREEIAKGRQCFVVCPLVEESETLQARAATAEAERLARTEFRDHRVELIHGQMPSKRKAEAMAAFASGSADVLVATSVIEVGIDVPNATVMLIEAAERYGLSQLHQLRGRIGRGSHESLCVLFGDPKLPRLEAIARERDGFKLAEVDLELRGEGQILGTRQHGLPVFKVARIPEDLALLELARDRADELLERDPDLREPEHALLRQAAAAAFGPELEPIPA